MQIGELTSDFQLIVNVHAFLYKFFVIKDDLKVAHRTGFHWQKQF